jgi:hypothetical protein
MPRQACAPPASNAGAGHCSSGSGKSVEPAVPNPSRMRASRCIRISGCARAARYTLSIQCPRPSMETGEPASRNMPVKRGEVSWRPWSVLQISGLPKCAKARATVPVRSHPARVQGHREWDWLDRRHWMRLSSRLVPSVFLRVTASSAVAPATSNSKSRMPACRAAASSENRRTLNHRAWHHYIQAYLQRKYHKDPGIPFARIRHGRPGRPSLDQLNVLLVRKDDHDRHTRAAPSVASVDFTVA